MANKIFDWILKKQNEDSKAILNLNLIDKKSNLYANAQILIQTINLKNNNLADAKLNLEKYYEKEKKTDPDGSADKGARSIGISLAAVRRRIP